MSLGVRLNNATVRQHFRDIEKKLLITAGGSFACEHVKHYEWTTQCDQFYSMSQNYILRHHSHDIAIPPQNYETPSTTKTHNCQSHSSPTQTPPLPILRIMSGLEQSLFQLKFTAKQLNRQASKAAKEEQQEKAKIKKALTQGNNDIAQLYAQNAIRKSNERVNLLRLSSRIDAVASRVQTAVTMRSVTGNMTQVIKGMDKALQTMNLERISLVMDKFENQFEDLDSATNYYELTTNNVNALTTPQDQVDELLNQVADEAGIEMKQGLNATQVEVQSPVSSTAILEEKEDKLAERLRALRN